MTNPHYKKSHWKHEIELLSSPGAENSRTFVGLGQQFKTATMCKTAVLEDQLRLNREHKCIYDD